MIPVRHFYMIRHGETEANAARIMAGSLDSPLTARGRDQARAARDLIGALTLKPALIIHSHLSRARETARIINEALHVQMREDPDYAEIQVGEWEGVSYDLIPDDWDNAPGGETGNQFRRRVTRAKKRALTESESPPLIVCHGGVFHGFGRLYGIASPPLFRNCHLYEFLPAENNGASFPWQAWHYDHDDAHPGSVIRERCKLFHPEETSDI